MQISKISLALFAVALAGCGSNSTETPIAPATVDNAPAMESSTNAATSNEVASNAATSNEVASNAATAGAMNDMATNSTATAGDNYRVRGEVVEIVPAAEGSTSLMVKHEEIPGFMKAMTMRMPLANDADAGKLKAGDKIAFDMKKSNTEVSNIEMLPPSTQLKLAE